MKYNFLGDLAHIDESIPLDKKIYRIVDFYSAADLIDKKSLRLTCMDDYPDLNEGINSLFSQFPNSFRSGWKGFFGEQKIRNKEEVDDFVKKVRKSEFVSCWSKNPDSNAMWSMYSQDRCSVKLQTTVGKLFDVCKNSFIGAAGSLGNINSPILFSASVNAVRYENINELLKKLERKNRLEKIFIKKTGFQDDFEGRGVPRSIIKNDEKWKFIYTSPLKNTSYNYEEEIRLGIKLDMVNDHSKIIKIVEHLSTLDPTKNKEYNIFLGELKSQLRSPFSLVKNSVLFMPNEYLVEVEKDFIESVCIDPRADIHKKVFIEGYFNNRGVRVEQSNAFDAAYQNMSVFPHK